MLRNSVITQTNVHPEDKRLSSGERGTALGKKRGIKYIISIIVSFAYGLKKFIKKFERKSAL